MRWLALVLLAAGCTPKGDAVTDVRLRTDAPPVAAARLETATFALGWFWGPDSRFGSLSGVVRTRVGYAGGTQDDPTYHDLGDHTETIQIDFDPGVVSYQDLLRVFWDSHRPTRKPWSAQYKSAIFHHDARQERLAKESRDREAERLGETIHTDIEPADAFYRAEDYHQKYRLRHSAAMKVFEALLPDARAFTDSTAAARANAFLDGHLDRDAFAAEIKKLDLPEEARTRLLKALPG